MLWIAFLSLVVEPPVGEPPPELLRMVEYRSSIITAAIDATVVSNTVWPDMPFIRNCTLRQAPDSSVLTNRGDSSGVVNPVERTKPHPKLPQTPIHILGRAGDAWEHQDATNRAQYRAGAAAMAWSGPALGVAPGRAAACSVHEAVLRDCRPGASPRTYSTRDEGKLRVVTAVADERQLEWWLDPERGYQPVRVTLHENDDLLLESRSELAQFDGLWFPRVVEYFARGHRDGKLPAQSVTVHSAEFNRPDHPRTFTPESIGIVPREMPVEQYDLQGRELAVGFYDGKRFVAQAQNPASTVAGEAGSPASSPLGAQMGRPGAATSGLAPREWESAWRKYTRKFIERCQLTDDQAQKAWAICRDCELRAQAYVERHKDKFDDLDRRTAALRSSSSPAQDANGATPRAAPAAQDSTAGRQSSTGRQTAGERGSPTDGEDSEGAAQTAKLAADRARLLAPIDEIFEKQLKPRLDGLLTRAQRAATQPAASPQPAAP